MNDLENARGPEARACSPWSRAWSRRSARSCCSGACCCGRCGGGFSPVVAVGRLGARLRAGAPAARPDLGTFAVVPALFAARARSRASVAVRRGDLSRVDHAAHRLQPRSRPSAPSGRAAIARSGRATAERRSHRRFGAASVIAASMPTTTTARRQGGHGCTFAQDVRRGALITIRMRIAGREVVFHRCARCEVEQLAGRRRRADAGRGPGARSSPLTEATRSRGRSARPE